jgi:hypothetical protein
MSFTYQLHTLIILTPVFQKLTHAHTQRLEVQSELPLSVNAVFE